MGACCDNFFHKEEIHTNESRLRLLENKVSPAFSTANDPHFTYFLPLFEQHAYLQRLLRTYKHPEQPEQPQLTEDTNDISVETQRIAQEHTKIQQYLTQYSDPASPLRARMADDERRIREEVRGAAEAEACMVKLEIQSIEVVKGVSAIVIAQEAGRGGAAKEEHLLVNRARNQLVYREFVFPTAAGTLRLTTDPLPAALTIDVEDIAKDEVLCQVFNFKAKKEEFGFVALRMQFVSLSESYRSEKHQRLVMLEKELRLCELGRLDRLSEYRSSSHSNSHRNTILSEAVSEYPNQYEA